MRRILTIAVFAACSLFLCASAFAIDASATLPGPNGVTPVMLQVSNDGTHTADWNTTPVTSIDFGTFTLHSFPNPDPTKAPYLTFLPTYFYSIDMGYTYGAGTISQITVQYTEGSKPTGQVHGLGWKSSVTWVKKSLTSGGSENPDVWVKTYLCKDMTAGISTPLTDVAGGWMRIYVGVVTDPGAAHMPAGAEVFSPGDVAGPYTGSITITSS